MSCKRDMFLCAFSFTLLNNGCPATIVCSSVFNESRIPISFSNIFWTVSLLEENSLGLLHKWKILAFWAWYNSFLYNCIITWFKYIFNGCHNIDIIRGVAQKGNDWKSATFFDDKILHLLGIECGSFPTVNKSNWKRVYHCLTTSFWKVCVSGAKNVRYYLFIIQNASQFVKRIYPFCEILASILLERFTHNLQDMLHTVILLSLEYADLNRQNSEIQL